MGPENNRKDRDKRYDTTLIAVRFSAMGDVAISIPVVYAVCRRWPGVRIVMVTRRPMDSLFVNRPENLTVVTADLKGRDKGVAGMLRLMKRLNSEYGPSALIDLHNVIRSRVMGLWARLHGIKTWRIDKGRGEKKALIKAGAKAFGRQLATTTERYARVFAMAGYDPGRVSSGIMERGERTDDGTARIGVAPFAAHKGKAYPPELMERVVADLAGRGYRIWLFGAPGDEQKVLDRWAEKYGERVVSVASLRPGLGGELELMSYLDVMVAMDSGNMHMASLAGTPVVSVWGATHPYAGFAAATAREDLRVECGLACRPCSVFGNKPCRLKGEEYACLRRIKPKEITEAVERALGKK